MLDVLHRTHHPVVRSVTGFGATAHMQQAGQENFSAVHALRGIAAFWVVLFHLNKGHHIVQLSTAMPHGLWWLVFDLGDNGVAIFFALSGFVIAHSIRAMECTTSYVGRFMLRRSIRLDPPFWLSMILVVVLGVVSAIVKHEPMHLPTVLQVIAHILYIPLIIDQPLINSVYWTLTFEVQFYLFLVAGLALAGRYRVMAIVVMALLAMASGIGLFQSLPRGIFLHLWHPFMIGALAYWSIGDRRWLLLFAPLLVIVLGGDTFAVISGLTALGLLGLGITGKLGTALSWRPLMMLGTISYSLYLIHNPITGAVAFVMRRLVGTGIAADAVVALIATGASIAVAGLFWWAVERPSQAFARRIPLIRKVPTPS